MAFETVLSEPFQQGSNATLHQLTVPMDGKGTKKPFPNLDEPGKPLRCREKESGAMPEHKPKPRSESRQRRTFLIARCTPDEKKVAMTRAEQKHLSLADFIRQQATGQKPLHVVRKPGPQAEAILLLKAELNKIGSNINQVAKVANTTGKISSEQMEALIHLLAKCYDEITKLTEHDR